MQTLTDKANSDLFNTVNTFGMPSIRRLALLKIEDGVAFGHDIKSAPIKDNSVEILGATRFGDHILVGRQQGDIGEDRRQVMIENLKIVMPKNGVPFLTTAVVDPELADGIYEVYDLQGKLKGVISGLRNTELVDQDLEIQAFIFEKDGQYELYAGNFEKAMDGMLSEDTTAGMKFIADVEQGSIMLRTMGKIRVKSPSGVETVYNMDGTVDERFDGLKSDNGVAYVSSIDSDGNFTYGLTKIRYYGDENIESYELRADGELDGNDQSFLEIWKNTPLGAFYKKKIEDGAMHRGPAKAK